MGKAKRDLAKATAPAFIITTIAAAIVSATATTPTAATPIEDNAPGAESMPVDGTDDPKPVEKTPTPEVKDDTAEENPEGKEELTIEDTEEPEEPATPEEPAPEDIDPAITDAIVDCEGATHMSSKYAIWDYSAHDDGSLTEFNEDYFIAHSWSAPGQAILAMEPGDIVIVDGNKICISEITRALKGSPIDGVWEARGDNDVTFQTCYPDEYDKIVFGNYVA